MRNLITLISMIAVLVLLGGCIVPLPPATKETRVVSPATNQTNLVVFKEPMVWYDHAGLRTKGIRLSEGTYPIESEDSEYRYFRAPNMIEYRTLHDGKVTSDYFIPGGFVLSKRAFDLVPAGVYFFVNEHTNILAWKLGEDFMHLEGKTTEQEF
jgi:hypothetical protein